MDAANDTYGNPLAGGKHALARWRFVYDYPEDAGGGVVSGEFLARSDGVVLRRMGHDTKKNGVTVWNFGKWSPMPVFPRMTDIEEIKGWLETRGYGLREPSPVAVDRSS